MTSHARYIVGTSTCLAVSVGVWILFANSGASGQENEDAIAKVALPFINKNCISCHGNEKPKADLVLTGFTDEKSVLKDRKKWEKVLNMVEKGEMPPESRPKPAVEDVKNFTQAIHGLFTRVDAAKRDPGRVVMRRLNKAEYANTIRDLLYINYNPTDEFPNDDVTGGFDNNASTLSLSQLLMERYLDAAENALNIAIPLEGSWPAPQRLLPAVIKPAPEGGDQRDPRMLRPGKKLFTNVNVKTAGEYVFRVYAWHIEGDWGVPKMDMEVDEQVVKTIVSTGQGIGLTAFYNARVQLTPGSHKLGLSWPVNYLDEQRREKFLKAQAKEPPPADEKPAPKEEEQAKEGPAKDDVNKEEPKQSFVKTPDFEPGLHMRWFEFAGPGTKTVPQTKILARDADSKPRDAAKAVLMRFASRAFRRPAQEAEVERILKLYDNATKQGDTWEAGVRLGMQAILVSPKFLFRVEWDDLPDSKEPHPIDDYALASRLSYFLWSTMPDEELIDLAGKKELHKNLAAQVKRLLADKKADALSENFAAQWLHLRLLKIVAPDQKIFAGFDEDLKQSMLKETMLFFDSIVREDRSILDLIDANYTFLNERLAKHYGIVDTKGNRAGEEITDAGTPIKGPKFVRVQLQGSERGGVLTQASVLTVTSNPTRTNPVKRGKWVLEQILNDPPPPPPENVPPLPEGKDALTGPLRQIMEAHRANPACANCHARMDPLGFAFENYDAIGKFRTTDNGFPVNAGGVLPNGQQFVGPGGLKGILKNESDKVAKSFTEQLLTYALGRGLEYADRPAVDRVVRSLAANDYHFSTLITEIVQSDPFRLRRGKDQHDE